MTYENFPKCLDSERPNDRSYSMHFAILIKKKNTFKGRNHA